MSAIKITKQYNEEQCTLRAGQWYRGCGCGQKVGDLVKIEKNWSPVFIQVPGVHVGPVSGIEYMIRPNTVALDIEKADADAWLADGKAREPVTGFKGRFARPIEK